MGFFFFCKINIQINVIKFSGNKIQVIKHPVNALKRNALKLKINYSFFNPLMNKTRFALVELYKTAIIIDGIMLLCVNHDASSCRTHLKSVITPIL